MKFQEVYSYVKQPNSLYTIKNVPIFKVFDDGTGEHGKVTEQDAAAILENFSKNAQAGAYPRVFIGHHNDPGVGNQKGIGFLDNLRLDGDTFYADLVEIPSDIIEEMKTKHSYPFRSVEYNPEIQEITGLAMLDSRKPFFTLPILTLADKEDKIDAFQARQYNVRKFQFQKGGNKMSDEINKKEGETEDLEDAGNDKMVDDGGADSLNQCQFKYQELSDGIGAKLDQMMGAISTIAETLQTLLESESEEAEMQGREGVGEVPEPIEPEEENQAGKGPGSVAMQFQALKQRMDKLEKENKELRKLQDPSRMTQFAGSYAPNKMNDSALLRKFQNSPVSYDAAKTALTIYHDTIKFSSSDKVKKFQEVWGATPERFVNHCVEQEELDPGYTKKLVN